MAVSIAAAPSILEIAPVEAAKFRDEKLIAMCKTYLSINGDASGGAASLTMQIPAAVVEKYLWELIGLEYYFNGALAARQFVFQMNYHPKGMKTGVWRESWVIAVQGQPGGLNTNMSVYGRDMNFLPRPLIEPVDTLDVLMLEQNPGAGNSLALTCFWRLYDPRTVAASPASE